MQAKQHPRLHVDWIDTDALQIVERLQRARFNTYFVGGCVRDLLVGIHPKDFDIATNAPPEDVRRLIPRSYIIGRRFRLVLARRGDKQYEIATFRRDPKPEEINEDDPFVGENFFGSPEEDARRRDFSMNAIFFDPVRNEIVDFTGGQDDIQARLIRIIGDPATRINEDPIRSLRALRLAHKLKFSIEPSFREQIQVLAPEIKRSVLPRRREEMLKFLRLEEPIRALFELFDLGLLQALSPTLARLFENPERLEVFEDYMSAFFRLVIDIQDPAELFAGLVHCYYKAAHSLDPNHMESAADWITEPEIKTFLRDELGMSNHEQSIAAHSIAMQGILQQTERYQKRGQRRLQGILKHASFPLALRFAREDLLLSGQDLAFWEGAYENYLRRNHELRDELDER